MQDISVWREPCEGGEATFDTSTRLTHSALMTTPSTTIFECIYKVGPSMSVIKTRRPSKPLPASTGTL
uniref:Uncharacterized protein n=1 Tax=Lepeophtheirus salmonis TaxID=72036 RepID=A0A0K2V1Y4_LEPSM